MATKSTKTKVKTDPLALTELGGPLAILPGEQEIDGTLVDQMVLEINRKYREGVIETMREIGALIVGRFFDASTAAFRSKSKRHASFRALSERDDLEISHTALWTAVKVVEHFELMGPELAGAISVSRHKALASAQDNDVKLQLARQVADNSIATVRQLEDAVRAAAAPAEPGAKKAGRPAIARVVKLVNQLDSLLTSLHQTSDDELQALSESDRQNVISTATDASESSAAWGARVRAALAPV